MKRVYKEKNVYDAAMDRVDFIFNNFERVYLSFSGGKDSDWYKILKNKDNPQGELF